MSKCREKSIVQNLCFLRSYHNQEKKWPKLLLTSCPSSCSHWFSLVSFFLSLNFIDNSFDMFHEITLIWYVIFTFFFFSPVSFLSSMPGAEAEVSLPCSNNDDCKAIKCPKGNAVCIDHHCRCSIHAAADDHQAILTEERCRSDEDCYRICPPQCVINRCDHQYCYCSSCHDAWNRRSYIVE